MGQIENFLKELMYMMIEARCKHCDGKYEEHCRYCETCDWDLDDGCKNQYCGGGHENGTGKN